MTTEPVTPSEPLHMAEIIESLYNFDRWELRQLAAEALLISDGPDATVEYLEQDPGKDVDVTIEGLKLVPNEPNSVTFNVVVNFPLPPQPFEPLTKE